MKLNVTAATAGLCGSCQHARVMVNENDQTTILCEENVPALVMRQRLKACTDYQRRGSNDIWEMKKIAWVLELDKPNGAGFVPPKKDE